MKPWTTSIEVSKKIHNLIGEQSSYFSHQDTEDEYKVYNEFCLSELAPVLKKIGEQRGWGQNSLYDMEVHLYRYLKVCELVATDGDANAYLLELLK